MTGRHRLILCGTCDRPIRLERDSVLGVGWIHTGAERPCIPMDRITIIEIRLVATPLTDEYKRREYALTAARGAAA